SYLADGTAVVGGETDPADRYIAPTVLRDVDPTSSVMQEEIFGPILPMLTVHDVEEAIDFVSLRPRPLALYLFTRNRAVAQRVVETTRSGGMCVNDIATHFAVPELPFGGVGESGIGAYHGR